MWGYRFLNFDGYGRYSLATIRALLDTGQINLYPEQIEVTDMPGWFLRAKGIDFTRLNLAIMPPHELRSLPKVDYLLTMYEATRIPDKWAEITNARVGQMIAPCQWVKDVFADNGVKVPIHVVPGGVDPAEFPVLAARPEGKHPYTFVCLGDRADRKGWANTWAAFSMAFKPSDDVRLIIKCRPTSDPAQLKNASSPDPMTRFVTIWSQDVESMADVFAHADCAVYPATADGYGMFPREAACTGLPVICTDYSGTAGCEPWAYPLRNWRLMDATLPTPRAPGKWAWGNIEEIAHAMRFCYEHRAEAAAKGLQAAAWLREHETWAHSAAKLLSLLEYEDNGRFQDAQQRWNDQEQQLLEGGNALVHLLQSHPNGVVFHKDVT